jgi:ferredoxin
MHIEADRDVCVGAGNCVLSAAEIFDQDDEGLVTVLNPNPAPPQEEAVDRAVRMCPSGALSTKP